MDEAQQLAELRRIDQLQAKAGIAPKEEPTPIWDMVKNVGTAAYKGVAGIASGAADALSGSHDVSDIVGATFSGKPPRELDTSMPVSRALEATGYQPKTQAERYVNTGVRAATGALISPAGLSNPIKAGVIGLSSGLGSEAAGQLPGVKGTKSEPYARIAGALASGAVGGALTSTIGNSKKLAAEMFNGVDPADVTAATALMRKSKLAGLPVNLDQALGKDTNVTNVTKALVGMKEGQPVVNQLREQTEQARKLATKVTDGLPGQVQEPAVVANASQAAATAAIKAAKTARTGKTKPLFDAAGDMPDGMLDSMIKQVSGEVQAAPDTNKGKLLADLLVVLENAKKRALPQPTGLLDHTGNPMMTPTKPVSMQELNASFRSEMNDSKNIHMNSSANDAEAVGHLGNTVTDLRKQMGAVSPNFKKANDLYQQISEQTVDPLKKSVVGRVAGIAGEQADKEAVNKLLPVLAKGRNPETATSEIIDFANNAPPAVFQDAVKTHFSNAVAKAEQQVHGALAPDLPRALEKTLLGDKFQRQGMKDMLETVGRQMNPREPGMLYKGFMHAMEIMSAAGKRPGSIGVGAGDLNEIAKQSYVAKGLNMIGLAPGKPLGRGLEGIYSANAYKTLADNLTTPEGVAKLQALAKAPLMGAKAQAILSTLLATEASVKPPEVQQSNPGDNQKETP